MKNSKLLNTMLLLFGLVSIIVGIGMVFFPIGFHATAGIVIGGDANLSNEMRAAGGPPLVGGFIIILGAFFDRLRFTAALLASALFLSYGGARLIGFGMDGIPNATLVQISVLEILIGFISAVALIVFQEQFRFSEPEKSKCSN